MESCGRRKHYSGTSDHPYQCRPWDRFRSGTGLADEKSLRNAVDYAIDFAPRRK